MSDLEMTKLCAQAMGFPLSCDWNQRDYILIGHGDGDLCPYWPLDYDIEAMALVKRFKLHPVYDEDGGVWHCVTIQHGYYGRDPDLNRAIVGCVAKMQANR